MRRIILNIVIGVMIIGTFCFPANLTKASQLEKTVKVKHDLDFTLVNNTGVEIEALFTSPTNVNEWEEDVLGVDTLPNGESVHIQFSREETDKFWDLKVEDHEGTYIYWKKLNLAEISVVKLYITNGKPIAVVE